MTLAEIHDADMAAVLSDASNTFTFDDVKYPCILADRVAMKDLQEGGFQADFDLSITTRADLLPLPFPEPGDQVSVDGASYRIVRQRKNFTGKILILDLQTIDK